MNNKFKSRKFLLVIYWNILNIIILVAQLYIVHKGINIKLPIDITIGVTGLVDLSYLGVNIAQKKIFNKVME